MNWKMNTMKNFIRPKFLVFNMIFLLSSLVTPVKSQTIGGGGSGGGDGGGGVRLPLALPPAPSTSQNLFIFADQRLAVVYPIIQKFKNLITSDPFNITASWTSTDICSYKGFYCESPPDNKSAIALASIDFNGFQLTAPTLDGFLDQLPDIALFHANSNNFAGTISQNISKLTYLYEIDISNNKFSGPFPTPIAGMNGLIFLDIRFNSFSGFVPPELFTKDLDVLFINDNNFMTTLPNIANTHILYLTLANNKFFGPIPRGIAKALSNLTEILLLNNLLTGCLPFELGYLTEAVVFDAGNNKLTGPLPFSFGCLRKLEILNLARNMLYGAVPEVICAIGSLANLSLSENYFTHVGPFCWRLIKNGVLDVKRNCIPGLPFQRSVGECAAFLAHPRYCPYMPAYAHFPCLLPYSKSSAEFGFSALAPSPS